MRLSAKDFYFNLEANYFISPKEHRLSILVVAVALLVYANTLANGFVWDDIKVILNNPALSGNPLSLFRGIDTARDIDITPYYRPLTLLCFLLEQRIHGLNPSLMHLVNSLLHASISYLVYRLVRPYSTTGTTALLASLLFAIHPLNSEAVNFLSARNTMLSTLCTLAGYLLHRRSFRNEQATPAFAAALIIMAGFFAKETTLAVLPLIILLELPTLRCRSKEIFKQSIYRLTPYILCTSFYLYMRISTLAEAGVKTSILTGLGSRLLDNLYIIPRYLLSILWPPTISHRYSLPDDPHLLALPLLFSWLCIMVTFSILLTRQRSKATVFGLTWLILFWLPTSGVVAFPSAPLADRYLYLPAIGIWLIVADQIIHFIATLEQSLRKYAATVVTIVLLLVAMTTVQHNPVWHSDISLMSRYVQQNPDSAFGHHNLGTAYLDTMNDLEVAEREFRKVIAINAAFPMVQTQMGYVLMKRGDKKGALIHYTEALQQNPLDAEALYNRGKILHDFGRYSEAINDFKLFLEIPNNEFSWARQQALEIINELRLKL